MILMPQIFDVIANENARYKRNELELVVNEMNFVRNFNYKGHILKKIQGKISVPLGH